MTLLIITIKMKLNVKHDPQNKQHGTCPFHNRKCTDSTGSHHSFLSIWEDNTPLTKIKNFYEQQEGIHVTRIEQA